MSISGDMLKITQGWDIDKLLKGSGRMSKRISVGLTRMPKIGERVRFVGESIDWLTVGKEYEVEEIMGESFYFTDDWGGFSMDYLGSHGDWELVTEGSDKMMKTLTEMPKVGDILRYVGEPSDGLTVGNVYEITEVMEDSVHFGGAFYSGDSFYYIDDDGGVMFGSLIEHADWELVSEPQPDIYDLIANLGRRLHEVEQAQAQEEAAKVVSCNFGYDADVQYDGDKTRITVTFDDLISGDDAIDRTIDVMKEWMGR